MYDRITDDRECEHCGEIVFVTVHIERLTATQDHNESFRCSRCGHPNNLFAIPDGD